MSFAVEGWTGWRYVAEEMAQAGVQAQRPSGTAVQLVEHGSTGAGRSATATCACSATTTAGTSRHAGGPAASRHHFTSEDDTPIARHSPGDRWFVDEAELV